MKFFSSIKFRLIVLIGSLLILTISGFGYIAWQRQESARLAQVERELQERMNVLISSYRPLPNQRIGDVRQPLFTERGSALFENEGGEPFYYAVYSRGERLQGASENIPEISSVDFKGKDKVTVLNKGKAELHHLAPSGRRFIVGRDIANEEDASQDDALFLALIGLLFPLIGLSFSWWISLPVSYPVKVLCKTANLIPTGEPSLPTTVGI